MNGSQFVRTVARSFSPQVRSAVKRLLFRQRHWAHQALRRRGSVQDLYYWVADDRLDTVILMHNYFSVFFPDLETRTDGMVYVYNREGELIGTQRVELEHLGMEKLRLSTLLSQFPAPRAPRTSEGTVLFNLTIPRQVLEAISRDGQPFYFWHRFYIAYTGPVGQPAYVHCVDKTCIFDEGHPEPLRWYGKLRPSQWAPEMPLDIADYQRFHVILINRAPETANVTLEVHDQAQEARSWQQAIPPNGVRRFELTEQALAGLIPTELRMRIKGMPTPWGRPCVLKEFANGVISVMHC